MSTARLLWLGAIASCLSLEGCTKTVTQKLTRFSTPAEGQASQLLGLVPESAVYRVKVRCEGQDDYSSFQGAPRLLMAKGTPAGFRCDEDGVVWAVAGDHEFALDPPDRWRTLVWYSKYRKQTQFGREMQALAQGAAAVGAMVGVAAVNVGIGMLEEQIRGDDDDSNEITKRLREIEKQKRRDRDREREADRR